MDEHAQRPPAPQLAVSVTTPTPPTRPGKRGGTLWSGNPKAKGGRTPSWIREQLRKGLEHALPAIKHALKTRKDLRTGQELGYADWLKTVEVASRISMPAQTQISGDGAPFTIMVGRAAAGELEEESYEPPEPPPPPTPPALPARVASPEPAPAPIVHAGAVPRRSPFGPGVG